jgi:hypothetical protein
MWDGFLSDVVHVPFAEHMLVPVPDDVSPAAVACVSDNFADAYARVAPGASAAPLRPSFVVSARVRERPDPFGPGRAHDMHRPAPTRSGFRATRLVYAT